MQRLSLSQRLTLVFTALLLLCAAAACSLQLYSTTRYGDAMVQRLSAGLAQQIARSESLLDRQGQVNREALKSLFDRLMTLNPSVELYMVSPDGILLADAAPEGHIKRERINLAPVQAFLAGAEWPVYGDDPRSSDKQKVFSVSPVRVEGQLHGYLYIILQGEALDALADSAWQHALWRAMLWSLLLVAALGLLAGGVAWWWITRPVRMLTREVSALEQESIIAIKRVAEQPLDPAAGNEVAVLQNAFIELSRKVASQWDALADNDRQRREFVANISHDLRTPLTALLGYLETLSVKADYLTPEESKHYLSIAMRQGNKVRHLSQQLFELARLEHGGIKPQPESFVMAELVQDVAQKFDLMAETRAIRIHLELPVGLAQAYADLSMMERVLTNLLDNAIRHTPDGGIITLRTRQEAEQLVVEIEDSGAGIPMELRASLFQRPSVLDKPRAGESRGGLGLMIVRRMLQLHGGDIQLVDVRTGACFRFSLPLPRG
ncbi:HAMP domain-containing histidine kinase [Yokenella regensburgei]|uniref:sensor histidine kinase n=1 Tax=Yokenella regensburgei TaxID=158877 RepID=UPI003F156CC4